jgi:hypothetical protein
LNNVAPRHSRHRYSRRRAEASSRVAMLTSLNWGGESCQPARP